MQKFRMCFIRVVLTDSSWHSQRDKAAGEHCGGAAHCFPRRSSSDLPYQSKRILARPWHVRRPSSPSQPRCHLPTINVSKTLVGQERGDRRSTILNDRSLGDLTGHSRRRTIGKQSITRRYTKTTPSVCVGKLHARVCKLTEIRWRTKSPLPEP